ncbi:MAG: hypothetical protein AAFU64_04975, partial [Bacteroidota bacterium]
MFGQVRWEIKTAFPWLIFILVLAMACGQSNLDYVIRSQQRLHRQIVELRQKQERFVDYTLERIRNIRVLLE